MAMGNTIVNVDDETNLITFAEIDFATTDIKGKVFDDSDIYATAIHEIGHALGISGHSDNPKDIMYPVSSKENSGQLSEGD